MNTSPSTVEASIPPNTVVPRDCRLAAPAPAATTSGDTPRMNASAVIRIGRSRSFTACIAASSTVLPSSRSRLANSTIRMAFLADSPISITSPIWP